MKPSLKQQIAPARAGRRVARGLAGVVGALRAAGTGRPAEERAHEDCRRAPRGLGRVLPPGGGRVGTAGRRGRGAGGARPARAVSDAVPLVAVAAAGAWPASIIVYYCIVIVYYCVTYFCTLLGHIVRGGT